MKGANFPRFDFHLWDFDGTLCSLGIDWSKLKDAIVERLGDDSLRQLPLRAILAAGVRSGRRDELLGLIGDVERRAIEVFAAGPPPLWDTEKMFAERITKSMIVTNNLKGTVERYLAIRQFGLVPIASIDLVVDPKPSTQGADIFAALWKGKRSVVFGDSEIDRELAKNLRLEFIKCSHGFFEDIE